MEHYRSNILLFSLLTLFIMGTACQSLVVEAPAGKIEGQILSDVEDNRYFGFTAIPYALPPVGDLRFAKPVAHPKFDNTFSATNSITACPQYGPFAFLANTFQEDCLTLNVYTDELRPETKKKVLVFVHGGGFIMGGAEGAIPGSFVVKQGVIVVTIQYRLGILGFLSTEDEAAPGNFGLWDQVLALKWVKSNIAAFGGDPHDVTISGESAGGASVSLLSLSPATKGLFTKVYAHSGSATTVFARAPTPHKDTLRLAKNTSCWEGGIEDRIDSSKSREVVKCLRKVPLSDIVRYVDPGLVAPKFVPTIDGEFLSKSPFELLDDQEYLKSIDFYDKAYLVAINNNEAGFASLVISMTAHAVENHDWESKDEKEAAMAKLQESYWDCYTAHRKPLANESSVLRVKDWYARRHPGQDALTQFANDALFFIPVFDFVDAASKGGSSKAWLLSFDYYPRFLKGDIRGMVHGLDLMYWLDASVERMESIFHIGMKGEMDEEDKQLRQSFSSVIADLMKTGDPGTSIKLKMEGTWPAYDIPNGFYLSFKTKPTVEKHLGHDKKMFWFKKL